MEIILQFVLFIGALAAVLLGFILTCWLLVFVLMGVIFFATCGLQVAIYVIHKFGMLGYHAVRRYQRREA